MAQVLSFAALHLLVGSPEAVHKALAAYAASDGYQPAELDPAVDDHDRLDRRHFIVEPAAGGWVTVLVDTTLDELKVLKALTSRLDCVGYAEFGVVGRGWVVGVAERGKLTATWRDDESSVEETARALAKLRSVAEPKLLAALNEKPIGAGVMKLRSALGVSSTSVSYELERDAGKTVVVFSSSWTKPMDKPLPPRKPRAPRLPK